MKRILIFAMMSTISLAVFSQDNEPAVSLEEVTVDAANVVNKADRKTIYPTQVQKNASKNGYDILLKLSFANIRVDPIAHSISSLDDRGGVQLRINGIVVGRQEMIALDPACIEKIDFIDNPSVRYGQDVAYVIDIVTRRSDTGYTLGADISPTLTSLQGDGTVYGKWNTGKSELSLSYDIDVFKLKGTGIAEIADYTLNDGTIRTIERNDVETMRKSQEQNLKLTYNLSDSTAYVFQVSLSGSMGKTPEDYIIREIAEAGNQSTAVSRESEHFKSPVLDIYYFNQLTPSQSIVANAVGTYISTYSTDYYDEGVPYMYDVEGETASALSEVIYENRLKPFTLSVGLDAEYKYTGNDYTGDALAFTSMKRWKLYAFSDINGAFGNLHYSVGAGVSHIHYDQSSHNYNFLTFRPKVTLAYDITDDLQISYAYQMWDQVSRIAMISDASIRNNSMEWTVGNPDLKPGRDMDHHLELSYADSRWQASLEAYYKQCMKPNMAIYQRTADDRFIYTQTNQKEIDLLHTMAYADCWIVPGKLQLTAYGGMQRCYNYGFDYTHIYTSWFCVGNLTAYLGNLTVQAYADNGRRWLEGETRGYEGAYSALQLSYSHKNWDFSLTWSNPLCTNYMSYESELLNSVLHKNTREYNRNSGNKLTLGISWRFKSGNEHRSKAKTISLQDTDNGIIQ